MEREQGAQRGQMVTVESSEVRRTSQSDRQCVKEWRLGRKSRWRKKQEQEGGKKNSIKSNSMKEKKSRMEKNRGMKGRLNQNKLLLAGLISY